MRKALASFLFTWCAACHNESRASYLFVWAGDSANTASDFLGVIDANPESPRYGTIVASLPTGVAGSHPHHTELEMPASGHLLANGFSTGQSWLFDVTAPLKPRVLSQFGDLAGYSHPHTYVRLANGNVLATFQYLAGAGSSGSHAMHGAPQAAAPSDSAAFTGGLVELDERGTAIRSGAARDDSIPDRYIYPYSALPLPSVDRVISTTTDMNPGNTKSTAEWLQFWRLSDLKLLRSIALKPGARGNEHQYTGELRLLEDGKSIYAHTFNCRLYLLRAIDQPEPDVRLVHTFEGTDCGVPLRAGNYWVEPVPAAHAVVVLDIADPDHPREVSRVVVGEDETPHWLAIDPAGRRIVMNSGGSMGNRLFMLDFDPTNGRLTMDARFRDAGSSQAGITLTGKTWPHGFTGKAIPHGTVFSR